MERQADQPDVAALVERAPLHRDHPSYLEAFHEITIKVLADIHMRLAQGDVGGATDLVSRLRAKQDDMWERRKVEAARGVRP